MGELFTIAWRTILLYVLMIAIFRLMGKREVGELSVIDLVIFVMIAEVATFAIDDPKRPLFESIMAMILIMIIQIISSYLSLKSKTMRDILEGDPSVVIRNGRIIETEMRKLRYSLDDLFQQLREQQIGSIQEVDYAFLEPSGNLSVFTKDGQHPVLPLIVDGDIQESHLTLIQKDMEWFLTLLKEKNIYDPSTVFYCSYENNELFIQLKEKFMTS